MLNAFQKKLDALTLDPDDKFEKHVRERFGKNFPKGLPEELNSFIRLPDDPFHKDISQRIGNRATQVLEERLKRLILAMPGIVKRIHAHWTESPSGSEIKKLGGFVFAYLYQPKDFLPEAEHGLFGYLDDAYLVAIIYEQVIRATGKREGQLEEVDMDYLKQIEASKRYIKAVIPKETKKIEDMVYKAVRHGDFNDLAEALRSVE